MTKFLIKKHNEYKINPSIPHASKKKERIAVNQSNTIQSTNMRSLTIGPTNQTLKLKMEGLIDMLCGNGIYKSDILLSN